MEFAKRLRQARKSSGLPLGSVGRKSASAYSRIESGLDQPTQEDVEAYVELRGDDSLLTDFPVLLNSYDPCSSETFSHLGTHTYEVDTLVYVGEKIRVLQRWRVSFRRKWPHSVWVYEYMPSDESERAFADYGHAFRADLLGSRRVDDNTHAMLFQLPASLGPSNNPYDFYYEREYSGRVDPAILFTGVEAYDHHRIVIRFEDNQFDAYEIDCARDEAHEQLALVQSADGPGLSRLELIPSMQIEMNFGPVPEGRVRGIAWRRRAVTKM